MKSLVASLMFVFTCEGLSAQSTNSGIYTSPQEYEANKMSIVCSCNSSADKIKVHHLLHKRYVDIVSDSKQNRLNKDSVFGYRDCEQHDFRFYGREAEYRIIENKTIVIYTKQIATHASTGKVIDFSAHYYFSKGVDAPIYPLTALNLKKAFPGNLVFHDLLDVSFNNETSLSAYDGEHHIYKVNYLLSQSNIH